MDKMSKKVKRKPCPKCGCTSFNIFIFSNVYTCTECGWVGNHTGLETIVNSSEFGEQKQFFQRLLVLKELHEQNPEWDETDLLLSSGENPAIVEKYWDMKKTISKLFK